jgi:hypothetical protein
LSGNLWGGASQEISCAWGAFRSPSFYLDCEVANQSIVSASDGAGSGAHQFLDRGWVVPSNPRILEVLS